jgi:predicted RNA binding protein YcfA (HicA-like mRNA interferase family)
VNAGAVQAGLEELAGKKTGVRYRDLARILTAAGAVEVSRRGSHRSWKHPEVGDLVTLVDGPGDVLAVYIRMVRKYLKQITGEFDR